jgi:hypothetical protein
VACAFLGRTWTGTKGSGCPDPALGEDPINNRKSPKFHTPNDETVASKSPGHDGPKMDEPKTRKQYRTKAKQRQRAQGPRPCCRCGPVLQRHLSHRPGDGNRYSQPSQLPRLLTDAATPPPPQRTCDTMLRAKGTQVHRGGHCLLVSPLMMYSP